MTTKSKTQQEKHKMSEIDENISKLFDIKKRLGKGAYGIVWKALDKRTNETLAVKKIFDAFRDETDAQRTFREIIFLKAFRNHPNVIKLQTVYKAANNLDIYLIFEYMESDLHNIIKKGTILKDIHKRYVMYQLLNAIKYIHSGNVIHRDLKPSNVLIDSKCRCKLADFGLARSVSNRPMRENNDVGNDDAIVEPLLTDYVATRWYRAPEILMASKRYTKGIDMWSLGCILAEMIRGKPLFQGTSTINQIEKIVTALPEVTDRDINAVGAGFGSVLLSKQISRDRKTSLEELLSDAPDDAVKLVKTLLVLDPLARLTAKQALSHAYVEKFRNSIPEIELNADILPPFRDDVRLSVPEYRSKLYEIVQVNHTDKVNSQRHHNAATGKSVTSIKHSREQKPQGVFEKTEIIKKPFKTKSAINTEDKYISKEKYLSRSEKHDIEAQPAVATTKSQKKTFERKASSKTIKPFLNEQKLLQSVDDKAHYVVPRSKAHPRSSESLEDHIRMNGYAFEKRHSLDCSGYGSLPDAAKETASPNGILRKVDSAHRLYKSSSSLHRSEPMPSQAQRNHADPTMQQPQPRMEVNERLIRSTPMVTSLGEKASTSNVRNTKSDMMPTGSHSKKTHERICYEKRLKRLEEEIEKYKKEVKSFCKETFRHTCQPSSGTPTKGRSKHQSTSNIHHHSKGSNLPAVTPGTSNTPQKSSYFHTLSKGDHVDRIVTPTCKETHGTEHKYHHNQQLQQQLPQQHQQRSRPVSKFISRPQEGESITKPLNSNFQ